MLSNDSPIVSIVMPTFNRAHLLEPVIATIMNQSFQNTELLVIDDGSTDNTAELIANLSAIDSRIRYVPLPQNCGIGCARDIGLEYVDSNSKYIALADSDDLWLPKRLEQQVEVLEKYPQIDFVFGDFDNVNHVDSTRGSGMEENQEATKHLILRELEPNLQLIESGIEQGLLRSTFILQSTVVLRKEVFEKIGGYDRSLSGPEDLELFWRAAVLGIRFAYLNHYLIERHRYDDSITASGVKRLVHRLDALMVCRNTSENLSNRGELENYITESENRTFIKILHSYGKNGQRKEIMHTFPKTLKNGLSLKILLITTLGLIGPFAVNTLYAILRLRKRVQESGLR